MKLSKFIVGGTVIYSALFLIDFLTTLFAIDESGVYHSKLGLQLTMEKNPEELMTTFTLTPTILITYIAWIVIVCVFYLIIQQIIKKKRNVNV